MTKKELLRRYLVFLVGLFLNALGISFIIKAGLGSSPISSLPYVISLGTPLSLGVTTFIINILMIAGQGLMLKKEFGRDQWMQFPVLVVCCLAIDFTMWLLSFLHPEVYLWKIVSLLIGCAILGLGVSLEVVANVVMVCGEAFVNTIARKWKKEFGWVKIGFDCSLVASACIVSLFMFGGIEGVREGTVVAALLVGFISRLFYRRLGALSRWVSLGAEPLQPVPAMTGEHLVITIGREYGSGGREIGRRIAADLGIAFYDNALIDLVAKESHLTPEVVERREQNLPSTLLYELVMQDYTVPIERSLSVDDALFVAEGRVIRRLADERACVIVGRCADYVLQDHRFCFKVFVHADGKAKLERAVNSYGDSREEAQAKLKRVDKARANHYRAYTGRAWSDATNYDLTLDSSFWGIDESCRLLEEAVKVRMKEWGLTNQTA